MFIVHLDQETHDLNKLVYSWLSNITHANLDSLNQTVRQTGEQRFHQFLRGLARHAQGLVSWRGKRMDELLQAIFRLPLTATATETPPSPAGDAKPPVTAPTVASGRTTGG